MKSKVRGFEGTKNYSTLVHFNVYVNVYFNVFRRGLFVSEGHLLQRGVPGKSRRFPQVRMPGDG